MKNCSTRSLPTSCGPNPQGRRAIDNNGCNPATQHAREAWRNTSTAPSSDSIASMRPVRVEHSASAGGRAPDGQQGSSNSGVHVDTVDIVPTPSQLSGARYRPLCFHARGGMGEIWLAEDTADRATSGTQEAARGPSGASGKKIGPGSSDWPTRHIRVSCRCTIWDATKTASHST